MSVSLTSMNSSDNCPICFRPMGGEEENDPDGEPIDKDAIGHPRNNGEICCFHRSCISESAKNVSELSCWICQKKIDTSSFLSLKERGVIELKLVAQDAFEGVASGLMVGGLGEMAKEMGLPLGVREASGILLVGKQRVRDAGFVYMLETSAITHAAVSIVEGFSSTMAEEAVNLVGRVGISAPDFVRAQAISTVSGGVMLGLTFIAVGLCQRHLLNGRSRGFHFVMIALIVIYPFVSAFMQSRRDGI